MTYTNFNGAQSAIIGDTRVFKCVNEVCAVQPANLGTNGVDNFGIGPNDGTADTQPKFENVGGYVYITATSGHQQTCTLGSTFSPDTVVGQTVTQASSGAVGTVGAALGTAVQKFVVTNGIDFDSNGPIVINGVSKPLAAAGCAAANHAAFTTGTYEIIRTASKSEAKTTFLIFAPGQADCATYNACFNPNDISNSLGKVHDTTPLMPMWPSISNSIALHDTTLRVILDAGLNTAEPLVVGTNDVAITQRFFNIGYGSLGYQSTGGAGKVDFTSHSTCKDIQAHLIKYKDGGDQGYSTTDTPYPSLVDPNDATKSICDCRKMDDIQLGSANIMWDITCPGFLGNLLWPTVAGSVAAGAGVNSGTRRLAKITASSEYLYSILFTFAKHHPVVLTPKLPSAIPLPVLTPPPTPTNNTG
jgi:hypothetical protein